MEEELIEAYSKGKQGSVMTWSCIGSNVGITELIVMDRNIYAQRGGYSAQSYTNTLEQGLLPLYEEGFVFQQDNAPIHTALHTRGWFGEHDINVHPNWPPYSPDLNPIEHLWPALKEVMISWFPEIDSQPRQRQIELLTEHLPEAWRSIRPEIVERVVGSMPRRLAAVIEAQGWQTRF